MNNALTNINKHVSNAVKILLIVSSYIMFKNETVVKCYKKKG